MSPIRITKEALDTAIQHVNQGLHPTAALEKQAQQHDLNPNYIQRVGEGLNVQLSLNHFSKYQSHEDKKQGDFPIQDIPHVVKSVFTPQEKVQSIPMAYEGDVARFFSKQAEQVKEEPSSYSFEYFMKLQSDTFLNAEREQDEQLTSKMQADSNYKSKFLSLVGEFKKQADYRVSFQEFESEVLTQFGEEQKEYTDLVYKQQNLNESRGKGDTTQKSISTLSKEQGYFEDFLNSIDSKVETELGYKLQEDNLSVVRQQASYVRSNLGLTKGAEFEGDFKEQLQVFVDSAKKEDLEKKAFLGMNLGAELSKAVSNQGSEMLFGGKKESPNPLGGQDARLANLERKLILQELIAIDPILSKAPVGRVIDAYEQMVRISPQVSREKDIVRSFLRQAVASSQIEPFVGGQLTSLDIDMMTRKNMRDGKGKGGIK